MNVRTTPLARVLLAVVLAVALFAACGGSSAPKPVAATNEQSSVATDNTDSSEATDVNDSSSQATSKLPDDACALSSAQLQALAPQATLSNSELGDRAKEVHPEGDVKVDEPVYIDAGATGKLVICRYATGQGNSSNDATVNVTIVDFVGGVNEDPGPKLAEKALTKLSDGYATLEASASTAGAAGPPKDVSGLGDEAFHATYSDDNEQAVVARKAKVLVSVAARGGFDDNDGPTIAFDQLEPLVSDLLDKAVAAAGSSGPTPTTVKSSSDNSIVTKGAIDGTWIVRQQDVGGAAECGPPAHVDIPIASTDGTLVGHLEVGVNGDAKGVSLGSSKLQDLQITGSGGADVKFSDDSEHPKATLKIDTTLHGSSDPDTTVKGELSFTCP